MFSIHGFEYPRMVSLQLEDLRRVQLEVAGMNQKCLPVESGQFSICGELGDNVGLYLGLGSLGPAVNQA